ncbi:MAG: threonine--tRNA ligase [Candidatus Omnitrophota bacterium]
MSGQQKLEQQFEESIPKGYDAELYKIRHSAAHVMAQAVLDRFPGTKIAIGPPVEDGFYYDFDLPRQLEEEDLGWIENRMKEIIQGNHPFAVREVTAQEAREIFKDQPFKLELIKDLVEGRFDEDGNKITAGGESRLTIYQHDSFADLCRGPHVDNTQRIPANAVKLIKIAGAYWKGSEKNPMLTRIYGSAWRSEAELTDYLNRLEEAKKRDHRRVGRELELYMTSELVGSGFPLLLPKGATVRRLLESFILELERKRGYSHVCTPALAKVDLYKKSGHWEHYKHDMFPPIELETESLVLRPMNCPHHIQIYSSAKRSYRELPLRIAELGTQYRFERSGVVGGLSRVRGMTLNDAHIFCRPDQIQQEFSGVVQLVETAYKILGIKEYSYRLSYRDPLDDEKYVKNDEMWEKAQAMLKEAMDELGLPYVEAEGEAAFYGPKLDIQLRDTMGREETYSTVQIDFHLPNQFDLHYIGEDGGEHRPVMIHRGVISTMERMMAYLIELYAGAFPVWLAPVQAVIIPIADTQTEFAHKLAQRFLEQDYRVQVDDRSERMNAKIRDAQLQKIPYMLVVGKREMENESVSLRLRTNEDLGAMPIGEFESLLKKINGSRSLNLTEKSKAD